MLSSLMVGFKALFALHVVCLDSPVKGSPFLCHYHDASQCLQVSHQARMFRIEIKNLFASYVSRAILCLRCKRHTSSYPLLGDNHNIFYQGSLRPQSMSAPCMTCMRFSLVCSVEP